VLSQQKLIKESLRVKHRCHFVFFLYTY